MFGDMSFIVNIIIAEECPIQVILDDREEIRREKDAWILAL
jgi:hypothetical protein